LLDEHYLTPIDDRQRHGRKPGGNGKCDPFVPLPNQKGTVAKSTVPRLFAYINGGSPRP
jgi:hypothetical protein